MKILLSVVNIATKNIQLKDVKELSRIDRSCDSTHKFINNSQGRLVNLISIFRHGDRVPLSIQSNAWRNKACIQCEGNCKSVKCSNGMLTKKGYVQSKKLGDFIKKSYLQKISNIETIYGYHSKLERSISTLHGVLAAIDHGQYVIELDDTIISGPNETLLKNYFLRKQLERVRKLNSRDYMVYDEIISGYCSGTAFDCSRFTCNPQKILSFVEKQQNNLIYSSNVIRTSPIAMGISFGRFGELLKKEVVRRNSMTLISGHDSTIIKALSGLNIPLKTFPGYTSAVFIEVWEHPNKINYVRVVYNGEVMKFGLYAEEYVELDSFIKYIEMFSKTNSKIKEFNKSDTLDAKNISGIQTMAEKIKEAYNPLIEELERNGIRFSTKQVEDYDEDFIMNTDSVLSKSFLFGFGKKSEPEKHRMEIEIEDKKTGKTKIRVIECEKDDKKKCKEIEVKDKDAVDQSDNKKSTDSKNIEIIKSDECKSKDNSCNAKKVSPCEKKSPSCDNDKASSCEDKKASPCNDKVSPCNNDKASPCNDKASPCEDKKVSPCNDKASSCEKNPSGCEKKSPSCEKKSSVCDQPVNPLANLNKDPKIKTVCDGKSAFDNLPGKCKFFDNTDCEYFQKIANPKPCDTVKEEFLPQPRDGDCGNVSPGIWIVN